MSAQKMRESLKSGQLLLGFSIMYPAAGLIEGMYRGWDLVWIDSQHGQIGYATALEAVRTAAACGLVSMLRVPGHEPTILATLADLAPSALMVPMVNTAEEARAIVSAVNFPPLGTRSYGGRRPVDLYGLQYHLSSNPVLVAQIETVQAAQNAEAIIGTEGIDVLFIGPDDMKLSMGIPVETPPLEDPRLRQAMQDTARAARRAGKFCACIAASEAAASAAVEMGYQLLIGGGDVAFVRAGAAERLQQLQRGARKHTGTAGPADPQRPSQSAY